MIALTNVCSKKPVLVTNLTSSRHDRIVTNSSNQLCKANTSSQQLQLINLNKTTKSSCSPIKTINLMSQHCQTKSNLLTIVDKVDEYHEDTFLSKLSETESASSNMLDDSLTSLQWLQSLNIMKSTSIEASSCSLSPNSQTSDKFQPSLDCDLDSATIPAAASVSKTADSSLKSSLSASYCQPLSPPLSVQCSASPQSTCSSNASTKRRSKKNEPKTVQQQLQHQMSAPAILQPNKSQASNSASSSVVRNSFLKDRDEYRTNSDVKPPYSYSQLIILSMKESKQPKMTLQMIYDWIIGNFSYFKKADPNWQVTFKNSIRHNLSLNKCFRKIARQKDEPGKGGFWMLDPVFEQQLDQSSSLGLVNGKNYKRKRKICDDNDDKKKPKLDLVQFNELENCDFVKSDANLSQINKSHSYTSYSIVSNGCADNPAHYIDSQLAHVHHQQQANNQPDQQHQLQSQQASNAAHFDFGDSFNGSFASNGISYIKNFDDESSLFNFDPNLPSLDLDHFTDSSCTSNSSPDDLVSGLLKKSANLAHDNELSELFDITSQFNLDENFNSTNLINPSSEKKSIDLTVQGTGIRQPKWWPDSLLDLDAGLISVQSHIIQDDECDSAAFIADSHNSLDFGLNVDDLDWTLSLGHFKDSPGSQQIQQSQQQQQHHHHHQQHARKRFYTHQTKQNPAIHKKNLMSSKKENLAQSLGSGAGELALNLFDRLKKNRTDTSSKLISTFATNIERKISSGTRPSISLSKLLTQQDKMLEEPSDHEKNNNTPEPKLEKSKSEFQIIAKNSLVQSISLNTPLDKIESDSICEPVEFTASDQELIVIPPETLVSKSNQNYFVPCLILALSILVLLKYTSYILSLFLVGFLVGIGTCCAIFYLIIKMDFMIYLCREKKEEEKSDSDGQDVKNFLIQSTIRKEKKYFDGVYKGWMNELRESYSPESYFINKTRSVYLNLDGSLLRLQISSSRVPKRAFADEQIGHVQLNDLRIFELGGSEVSLLPSKLCRKRYWSKKYPISLKKCKLLNKKSEFETDTELILFARTDREKEEWYNLFKKASSKQLLNSEHYRKSKTVEVPKRMVSQNSFNLKYDVVNDKIVYREEDSRKKEETDLNVETQTESSYMYDSSLAFMNTFLIRVFADFFYNKYWIGQVQTKIQNKLNKIRMPYFVEGLIVTGVDLGSVVPLIKQVSEPWYDDKGLWVHLDIDYNGSIQMSLATKLNLMKLKNDDSDIKRESKPNRMHNPAIEHSSEEDSPESSGDEYIHSDEENKLVETVNPSKKLLNLVNKIAASNYFQKATEMNFIKKAMENVSNCQLLLNVELKRVSGTVALNIPPHPSDRVWYGFVAKPKMDVVATPQVGETEVSYAAISDFIADKLKLEFQKLLVFPNMDDFYIPLLNSEVKSL